MFSNKRNWRKSLQGFSKSRDFLKLLFEIFNRTNSISDDFSFSSFYHSMTDKRCWNGNLRSCYLLWWYVFRCWRYHLRIFLSNVSCWVSVSNWFKYCSISLRSSSSFQIIWFVTLILLWCYSRKLFFSLSLFWWEKFRGVLLPIYRWILHLSSKNLRIGLFLVLQWFLLCTFSWDFFCSTDVHLVMVKLFFSVQLFLSPFPFSNGTFYSESAGFCLFHMIS